jgi:hypothetical protein
MTAWSMVVAECLGFSREEALSVGALDRFPLLRRTQMTAAQAYTEMNATSKGQSLGILPHSPSVKDNSGSSQPFVDLMGRKVRRSDQEDEPAPAQTGRRSRSSRSRTTSGAASSRARSRSPRRRTATSSAASSSTPAPP